ncbi:hypothetical protein [Nocardia sp. NBC_00403]|uniref:hypothetical protein n=1 Tax=Nocardia sp. NBC_00403 TaxID=2975990 RepID=UPI002E22C4DC
MEIAERCGVTLEPPVEIRFADKAIVDYYKRIADETHLRGNTFRISPFACGSDPRSTG